MAIDGIKIIDSDLAHDVYSEFMDLYDSNVAINEIKRKIEKWKDIELDEVDYEIFITTYALALWEIGELTQDIINELETIIKKESVAKLFLEETGEKDYKARNKVTAKYLQKMKSINNKLRKRKKYKKITNLLFTEGDMFYINDQNKIHYCGLVYEINQYRGKCYYYFAFCDYTGTIPVFDMVINKINVFGREIPSGIKTIHGDYVLGIDTVGVEHKDLISFQDNLKVFGRVSLKKDFSEVGSYSYIDTYEELKERFINSEKRHVIFDSIMIPLIFIIE